MISFPYHSYHERSIVSNLQLRQGSKSSNSSKSPTKWRQTCLVSPNLCQDVCHRVEMELRPVNSSHWTLFLFSACCLIYQSFWYLIMENRFPSLHILCFLLASCLCPDMHPWFSKQMNLNRKDIQGLLNVVVLILFFWSQCLEQERSSLCSILQNLCVGSTSMPSFAVSSWNIAISMDRGGQGREKQLGQYGVLVLLGVLFL